MAVESTKLGPGLLTLGAAGSSKEFGIAIRKAVLTPSADDGETLEVLSGDTVVDSGEEKWKLEGTILQGYDTGNLLMWCNTNSGQVLPFKFKPTTAAKLEVSGNVLVRSVSVGGDVKARNTSDFSWTATDVVFAETV